MATTSMGEPRPDLASFDEKKIKTIESLFRTDAAGTLNKFVYGNMSWDELEPEKKKDINSIVDDVIARLA